MNIMTKSVAMIIGIASISACSYVSPWEKGNLARPEMGFITDPTDQRLSDHIYFSKEASSSGSAVSGGGCGCN